MDVTKQNFHESLEIISEAIDKATFLAVDTEFTGLSLPGSNIHNFETPDERYRKIKESASNFLVVQFGLAAFQYVPEKKRYCVRVFNFYVFPRPFARQAPDVRFTCQSSSLDFLATQGFDFNKWIRDGIPYLLPPEEERLKAALHEKHSTIDLQNNVQRPEFSSPAFTSPQQDGAPINKGPCVIPEDHAPTIDAICAQVQDFLQSDRDELPLSPVNGYIRKLTYQAIAHRFNGVHLEAKTDSNRLRYIMVTKATSPEEMRKKEEAKRKAEFEEVEDAVGFSKVIRLISKSRKLVVGHNMLLDLLHIMDKFCYPLPEDYDEFKHMANTIFPSILDTKYMASTAQFKDNIKNTALGNLHKTLEELPFKIPEIDECEGMKSYSTAHCQQHEAGYDAFLTGRCFIALSNYLGADHENLLASSSITKQYMNKLFLMRMFDIPYMNLAGEDMKPARDHVFHIVFPKDWKASDLNQLFSPYGQIQIVWIDDITAYVALYQRDQAELVMKSLPNTEYYQLSRYKDHVRRRSLTMLRTPSSAEKRKPSPLSDIQLPRKKRRSSRESPFPVSHTIPTIPEEEEAEAREPACDVTNKLSRGVREREEGEIDSDSTHDNQDQVTRGDGNGHLQDIGEPVSRKRPRMSVPAADPMFVEPDTW